MSKTAVILQVIDLRLFTLCIMNVKVVFKCVFFLTFSPVELVEGTFSKNPKDHT